jgi:hypothetical protein
MSGIVAGRSRHSSFLRRNRVRFEFWEGEAPAEPEPNRKTRLGGSLALPFAMHAIAPSFLRRQILH